jgi:alanyl aminopeptidase
MSSFLDQPGVPQLTVEPAGGALVKLSQKRFVTMGEPAGEPQRWRIPVILRYPAGSDVRTLRVWLTGADTTVDLGLGSAPAWIMPNAGASGYYRWRVPAPMLAALAGPARTQLTERERIDVLHNLAASLRAGQLAGDRFLELTAQLADDAEPEVVGEAARTLRSNRLPLVTPAAEPYMAAYLRVTFDPALRRFGMKPRAGEPDNVALMRPELLFLLGESGRNMQVVAYAETLGAAYRRDPASIPPSLVEPALLLGAVRGDRALFDEYRHRFETSAIPLERLLYLSGLGWFKDPALRKAALDYSLTGPLRPQETLVIPYAMGLDRAGSGFRGSDQYPDDVVQWMMDHWDAMSARLPPQFAARILRIASGCSKERAQSLMNFCADPKRQEVGVAGTMRRLIEAIEECGTLHDREAERVARWMIQQATAP